MVRGMAPEPDDPLANAFRQTKSKAKIAVLPRSGKEILRITVTNVLKKKRDFERIVALTRIATECHLLVNRNESR